MIHMKKEYVNTISPQNLIVQKVQNEITWFMNSEKPSIAGKVNQDDDKQKQNKASDQISDHKINLDDDDEYA